MSDLVIISHDDHVNAGN